MTENKVTGATARAQWAAAAAAVRLGGASQCWKAQPIDPILPPVLLLALSSSGQPRNSSSGSRAHALGEQSHDHGRSTVKDDRTPSEVVPGEHRDHREDLGQGWIEAQDLRQKPDHRAIEAEPDDGNYEQPEELFGAREATAAEN